MSIKIDPAHSSPRGPEDSDGRQKLNILYALTILAILYASVHKLWLPIIFKLTKSPSAQYLNIDYWIFAGLAFWWHLGRTALLGVLGSLLCGVLIAHGIQEITVVATKPLFTWRETSQLLASVPLMLLGVAWILLGKNRDRQWPAIFSGFFLAALFSFAFSMNLRSLIMGSPKKEEVVQQMMQDFNPGVPQLDMAKACGKEAFWVNLADYPDFAHKSEISVNPCGLSPAFTRLDRFNGFEVTNRLKNVATVQVVIFQRDGQRRGFNRLLKPKEKLHLHRGNFNLADGESVLLSVSEFESGVTAIFPNQQRGLFRITKKPLEIIPLEEKTGVPRYDPAGAPAPVSAKATESAAPNLPKNKN